MAARRRKGMGEFEQKVTKKTKVDPKISGPGNPVCLPPEAYSFAK
jgi:hypothetical protein